MPFTIIKFALYLCRNKKSIIIRIDKITCRCQFCGGLNKNYDTSYCKTPSISICPALISEDTPNLKKDVLEKYSITGLDSNEWRSPVKLLTPDDIFDLATYDIWEVVSEISMEIIDNEGTVYNSF